MSRRNPKTDGVPANPLLTRKFRAMYNESGEKSREPDLIIRFTGLYSVLYILLKTCAGNVQTEGIKHQIQQIPAPFPVSGTPYDYHSASTRLEKRVS